MIPPLAIAAALLQVGIRAKPVAEHRGPGLTLYRLALAPADMAKALRSQPAIAAALDTQGVTVSQRGATFEVCRPLANAPTVRLAAIAPCLGVEASGQPVTVTLDRSRPHAIVGGQTGSGKSELLRTLALLESRQADTRLVLIDLKASGMWSPLALLGHSVATDAPTARALLTWAAGRIGAGEPGRVVVIIDEAARLDAASRALALEIAERGRADDLHLVAATQYIRADVLDRRLTTSADWRIAGRVFDGQASRLILGQNGAEHLTGRGDMLISAGGAPARRFRAALADDGAWTRAGGASPLTLPSTPAERDPGGMVAWAADRIAERGRVSAAEIAAEFRIGTTAARRIRDDAAAYLPTGGAPILAFPGSRVGVSR